MSTFRSARRFTPAAAALAAFALASPVSAASADDNATAAGHAMPGHDHSRTPAMSARGNDHTLGMIQHDPQMMRQMIARRDRQGDHMAASALASPGQDAFGAIQEVVRKLEADPKTEWSKVDLEALRQHLVDMSEVTLNAGATAKTIDGGLEIAVTGAGRTLAAIQRMVPAHAQELSQIDGWSAKTDPLPNGVLLTVTSSDAKEVTHIRGLGFAGLLVSGSHHQPHHLAMVKGESPHQH
jgi:hypothetical protein